MPWSRVVQGLMGHWTLAVPKVRVSITYLEYKQLSRVHRAGIQGRPMAPPPPTPPLPATFLSF